MIWPQGWDKDLRPDRVPDHIHKFDPQFRYHNRLAVLDWFEYLGIPMQVPCSLSTEHLSRILAELV